MNNACHKLDYIERNQFHMQFAKIFRNRYYRFLVKQFVKRGVYNKIIRNYLNRLYNKFNYQQLEKVHSLFAKIYRTGKAGKINAKWVIKFADKDIFIPLKTKSLWLDWDTALSIKGHDTGIKFFYEKLVNSNIRPKLVFDIGANYGTHSLLFLAHGIDVVSFEPNPACVEYIKNLLLENQLNGYIENIALGDKASGEAKLTFYERDTWLGTLKISEDAGGNEFSKTISVPVSTLDEFCKNNSLYPDLLKIDTEGYELEVLKGGQQLILEKRPAIIFESNSIHQRSEINHFFLNRGYDIYALKSKQGIRIKIITEIDFANSLATNFIALPAGSLFIELIN